MSDPLIMWTIYDRPRDFPETFVARKFEIDAKGARPTNDIIVAGNLEWIRERLLRRGMTCMMRSPMDEPQIVETWL